MDSLRSQFLLDPEVVFLNHGSFGACPRPVFEVYQAWQAELERQPVEFLGRQIVALLADARQKLALYLGVAADEVVYFPNPTTAINMVARNLELQPGDEILATNHEYGAMDRTWRFICGQSNARYIQQTVPLPVRSQDEIVEAVWSGVTARTRVMFISHITSPTALIFPVAELCSRARQSGILTIIDGAHAPGQIDLNLTELGADIYTGACHKWLCAPKGGAFLYARREIQPRLQPLVVSWGYESEKPSNSQFIDYHEWQGTRDMAAFLSVPAAIDFQATNDWPAVRRQCHNLAVETRRRINATTGLEPICPESSDWFNQMFIVRLPKNINLVDLKTRLYDDFRVEIPTIYWNGQNFLRISIQGYNTRADTETLFQALQSILPEI
jgi:isopenicillin-N epimerase